MPQAMGEYVTRIWND